MDKKTTKIIISKSILPYLSSLEQSKYDYTDSFQGTFCGQYDHIHSAEISKLFFASIPKWGQQLLKLRNKIVQLFGLKSTGSKTSRQNQYDNFKWEQGAQFGSIKVFGKTENEVIWGIDDEHLDFRVSIFLEQQKDTTSQKTITVSTLVKFNNWFGKFYFSIVAPFHKLLVVSMVKKVIKQLEPNKGQCS